MKARGSCRALVESRSGSGEGVAWLEAAAELGDEPADRLAELGRTADAVALPERQPPGLAERGRDEHRSWVISWMRQLVAPSAKTSPTRDS